MGSDTIPQLPVICLSDKTLKPGTSKWIKVRNDVRKALEDYSCFEASYDGVSMDLQKSFVEAMEELFNLPLEVKQRNVYPLPFVGYLTLNNLSESFGVGDANILEKVEEFTKQFDGVGNKRISETITNFAKGLAEVDVMVRRMIMESFGLEKYIEEHLNSTNYRMRMLKYIAPPNDDDGDANAKANTKIDANANAKTKIDADVKAIADAIANVGINDSANHVDVHVSANGDSNVGANGNGHVHDGDGDGDVEKKLGFPCHTDKNLLTVIFQHEIEGLDVKTKDGKWIRVKPSPNTFIVLVGDALYALMNGRLSATQHRVGVNETRYSTALFTSPNGGYIIEPPKELVDENHPRLFKPFDYEEFMSFFNSEAGRKEPHKFTLQAYCGA